MGGFHLRSYYKILYSTIQSSFPWKSLWKSKVPMKVSFFLWTAALGRILTTYNLWNRQVVVMDWCFMCKKDGETIAHLLLHCHVIREFGLWYSLCWGLLGYAKWCCGNSS